MKPDQENDRSIPLDDRANEEKRRRALRERCAEYRKQLKKRDPLELASLAAVSVCRSKESRLFLSGEHLLQTYYISWPDLSISDARGKQVSLSKEVLWLHYLDRADGHPLAGRWVNLSEIGGLFYQQAFQGYCGDELAETWGENVEGLRQKCMEEGGWELRGLGDLAFEWRVLPRLPLCLCYRLPAGTNAAWATMLFDASAGHYVAADVAAIVAKELADRLKPAV